MGRRERRILEAEARQTSAASRAAATGTMRVAHDVCRTISRARAVPAGYACFVVIVKQPGPGEVVDLTVASYPRQDPDLVRHVLLDAAKGITPGKHDYETHPGVQGEGEGFDA